MTGVILAGGLGTRLKPLTCNLPKPMVPLMNRPLLEHILLLLKKHGITRIVTLLYHQPEIIKTYFKNGAAFTLDLIYQENKIDLGTAGSLKEAAPYLNESFIVISGDLVTDTNLSEALTFHRQRKALATIILSRVKYPLDYGIVMTNEAGKVTRFFEKPGWGQVFSDTINAGQYILEPEILKYIPPQQIFDFSHDLFPLLLEKNLPLYGFIAPNYWKDVGNLREYQQAHWDCLQQRVDLNIPGKQSAKLWIGEPFVQGLNTSLVGPVVIGKKCQIGADVYIHNSVIGNNCVIDDAAQIINSIIWDNVKIGKQVSLHSVVIARGAHIKDQAYIAENSFISENCVIGAGSTIRPNVKIWPNKIVEDKAVLASSLVWGDRWLKELFTDARITGITNTEISPEFGAKLGAVLGAMFEHGKYLTIGHDAAESSRMICQALASGIVGAGVHVHDLRNAPIPIVRYQLRSSMDVGAVFIRKSPFEDDLTDILFFDDDGRDLPITKTKAIEKLFFQEDFRRASYDRIGKVDFPVRQVESYAEDFLTQLALSQIKESHFKIIVDYSHGSATEVLPKLLGALGCEVISLNAYLDSTRLSRKADAFNTSLTQLVHIVKSLNADIGFLIDAGAEKIHVIDEKGRYLTGDRLLVLLVSILIKANDPPRIAVPITASAQIEELARPRNIHVVRTANEHRALVEAAYNKEVKFAGDTKGGFIFTHFQFAFDGMFALAKLLDLMARTQVKIGELHDELPHPALVKRNVSCPWESKGYIMRRLMESTDNCQRHLVDGIKIFSPHGWVLILPDRSRPLFHINAEAHKQSVANEMVEEYTGMIARWLDNRIL